MQNSPLSFKDRQPSASITVNAHLASSQVYFTKTVYSRVNCLFTRLNFDSFSKIRLVLITARPSPAALFMLKNCADESTSIVNPKYGFFLLTCCIFLTLFVVCVFGSWNKNKKKEKRKKEKSLQTDRIRLERATSKFNWNLHARV